MTSILCGLAAACCWAGVNLLGRRFAGDFDAREFAFWFNALGCALSAPVGLAFLVASPVSLSDVLWLALAGTSGAAGMRLLALALGRGQLGVIGPLVSVEGAIAAALTIATGGQTSLGIASGLLITIAGTAIVAVGAGRRGHFAGSSYALPAAGCAGVGLWAFARQPLMPASAFAIMRAFGAIVLAPSVTRWRRPNHLGGLASIAALDVAGNMLFLVGTRVGSIAATDVLAAQFGPLTALGALILWRESLKSLQIAGLIVLGTGVTVTALATH